MGNDDCGVLTYLCGLHGLATVEWSGTRGLATAQNKIGAIRRSSVAPQELLDPTLERFGEA